MVSKQEEDHEELGQMISRIGHNWEITVNWKELQRTEQFETPWLVNLLLKKKTQEEEEEDEVMGSDEICKYLPDVSDVGLSYVKVLRVCVYCFGIH